MPQFGVTTKYTISKPRDDERGYLVSSYCTHTRQIHAESFSEAAKSDEDDTVKAFEGTGFTLTFISFEVTRGRK